MNNSAQVTPQSSRAAKVRESIAIQRLGRGGKVPALGHSAIKPALVKALTTGGAVRTGLLSINWDVAGNGRYRCLSPVGRSIEARQGVDDVRILKKAARPPSWLDMKMRCRKCEHCLKLRAYEWANRALVEIGLSARTWFGTMTLRPSQQLLAEQIARKYLGRAGADFDALSAEQQFAERHRVISRWITRWVKRVRRGAPSLRLMVVAEAHQSGLPHYHCLIHESVAFATLETILRQEWHYGFTKFLLVDKDRSGKAAWYVAKYLCKATECRVRASVAYGKNTLSKAP